MKKRIILITLILITFFIIFNYKVFLGNYYFYQAKGDYLNKNFSGALEGYNNSSKYLSGSKIDFNKGNTYYKIGERTQYINDKIDNYLKSLQLYSKVLEEDLKNKKKADPYVRYNYDFVKKKLEELQEKQKQDQEKKEKQKEEQEDKNQEEKDENKDGKKEDSKESDNGEQKDENSGDKNDEESDSESKKEEEQGEENELGDKANEEENYKMADQSKLSPEELNQIENYVENLKEEEKYNREYLNNIKPMSNDPFFDNVFDRGGDKDW